MLKSLMKRIYKIFPFSVKHIFRDIYLYTSATINGAINIKKIEFIKNNERAVVLGNGPSLNSDRQEIQSLAGTTDFVCVNNFCDDELYIILRPTLYIFLDAYFFSDEAHKSWISRREKTFDIIDESTSWEMNIVVPGSADVNLIKRRIKNKNVRVFKFNALSLFSSKPTRFQEFMFDIGLYGPPQINVLIYGIYLAIVARYKDIKFYGADLSFHNDVKVDQQSNKLYIEYKHFHQRNTIEPLMKNPGKIEPWSMAELMKLTSDTFYAHEILNSYALKKGVVIENASSYSLIDAYPRSKKVSS
jgi:hypothetical protein